MEELFKRQCSRVYRVAMIYLKNASDVEDAVQNIFPKYMEKEGVQYGKRENERCI